MPESNDPVAQAPVGNAEQTAGPDPEALADQFKKDELKAAAAVQGVDVPSGATKVDIAEAITQAPTAVPVTVDNRTKRSDEDALLNSWVDVIAGQHAARFGSYVETVSSDPTTGYPRRVLVRTRDALNELIEVAYEHLRPSERTGGR